MCKSILKGEIALRKLELADAEPMLAWMQNPDIYKNMQYDPKEQSVERCRAFIQHSWEDRDNRHYAITNGRREYLGTFVCGRGI